MGELRVLCLSNIVAYDRHYVDVEFLGDIGDQDPVPQAGDGSFCEYGWFPLRDPPQPLFEPMRLAIASLLSGDWYHAPAGRRAGRGAFRLTRNRFCTPLGIARIIRRIS